MATNSKKPKKTSKFIGDNGVKVGMELLHHLPFCIQKRRITGDKLMPIKIRKDYGNYYLEYTAPEPINITDIKRLIGIFKFFQDNESRIEIANMPVPATPNNPAGVKEIYSINNINFFKFCLSYTNAGKGHEKDVADSLTRLNNYIITRTEKTNEINKKPTKYLYDYVIINNIASFSILKSVYERIKAEGLILKLDTLLKIKGNTAVSLYIFLCGQNKTTFREKTLFDALGLADDKFSRIILKESFLNLKTVDFIDLKDGRETFFRKEPDDNYYDFKYTVLK
jgi:hypothetical protein